MSSSWGIDLWDQYENLSVHTHKGIEFLDKYGQFVKERCAIEIEYATKLRRLVKNHQLKKKDEEDTQYTYYRALFIMLQEICDLAGQHELIAENMSSLIVKEIALLLKELKDERKRYLNEGAKHQNSLHQYVQQLDKAKKGYEKSYKEAEKAQESYTKADADLNLSRAEVEKARMVAVSKNQLYDEAKTEYANHLQKTNDLQKLHYFEYMPKVYQQLQDMEERRIACVQNFMQQSSVVHKQVLPIVEKCLDGIVKAADSIDPKEDTVLVIERFKSGNQPPDDIPFEDLSNPRPPNETTGSNHLTYSNSIKSETLRGTLSAARFKKRGGLFAIFSSNKDDYADLPPNQRRKKIQQKIDQLQAQINQETAVRDGLMKMKVAYEQNPALGDPGTIEGQLRENGERMEKLHNDLRKFQSYLSEINGKPPTPINQRKVNRNSISEDSLSRSASDSSVSNNQTQNASHKLTTNYNHNQTLQSPQQGNDVNGSSPGSSNRPDSMTNDICLSHLSINDAEFADADDYESNDFVEENELLPALGKAKSIYPFEAQSEGSIAMEEGEEFDVVELDQGDGWTRVRRKNLEEGFVPTSYIEIEIYNNC